MQDLECKQYISNNCETFKKPVTSIATSFLKAISLAFACTILPLSSAHWASAQAGPAEARSTKGHISLHTEGKDLSGQYGYVLMDADTGEIVAKRNADRSFIPASLAKIPTMLMALQALGADHRFETRLVADGRIDQGVLHGNLHLIGSGDPTLKTLDLERLSDKLALQGIARITGDFIYNTDALPRSSVISNLQPNDHHYNPAISGLNLDLNLWRSNGIMRKTAAPGYRAARLFRSAAALRGITLPMPKHFSGTVSGQLVASHLSATVSEICETMMMLSTNLTAEALGALSASTMGDKPKSLRDAAKVTTNWLKDQADSIGGKGWKGFTLANHSGLSSRSRATPRQMASILRLGFETFGETFRSLHAEHVTGGFQAFAVRGKTGKMRFVRGYSGFLSIGGRDLIFVIMSNDRKQRRQADAGAKGLGSKAWMRKAQRLELAVLGDFIANHWPTGADVLVADAKEATTTPTIMSTSPQTSVEKKIYTVSMAPVETELKTVAAVQLEYPTEETLATFVRATRPVE